MNPFSLLIKPVSATCNLECGYCFYRKTKEFYPARSTAMTAATLETLLKKYLEMRFDVSSLCFQGGEPLLADRDLYHRIPGIFNAHAESGQTLEVSFQTNATLITREWTTLFKHLHALVGVSLDGPAYIHDTARTAADGSGTFSAVMKGIDRLREEHVPFNILSMITPRSCGNAHAIYDFILREEFRWLQFIPCLTTATAKENNRDFLITGEEYARFYSSLFDRWFENGYPHISIRLFEDILFYLVDAIHVSCTFREKCDGYLVIEYNGDVYPCDFFVNNDWRIGNIHQHTLTDMLTNHTRSGFLRLKPAYAGHCRSCKYFGLCRGGCAKHYLYSGKENSSNHFCNGFRRFLDHAYDRFLELRDDIIRRRNAQ